MNEKGSGVKSDDNELEETDGGNEGDTSAVPTLQERMRSAELEFARFVHGQDKLTWWCQHQHAYPPIARVATI